jgi:hypothetical protein
MSDTNFNFFQDYIWPEWLIWVDFITDKLDAEAGYIKWEFTFTPSGSIAISQDANNWLWISPNGILWKKNGNNTFTITNQWDATFAWTLAAATGVIQNVVANNITITWGSISWANVTAPAYSQITWTKPPTNAEANPSYIKSTYIDSTSIQSPSIAWWTITGSLIQTSTSANTWIKMSSSIGWINVFWQSIYIRNSSWTYIGAIWHAYTGLTITSSQDIILESSNIKVHWTLSPIQNASYNLWNSSYRFGNVYTFNVDFASWKYINYTWGNIQSNSDFRISWSLRLTWQIYMENHQNLIAKDSWWTLRYLRCQYNSTLWKYILST